MRRAAAVAVAAVRSVRCRPLLSLGAKKARRGQAAACLWGQFQSASLMTGLIRSAGFSFIRSSASST